MNPKLVAFLLFLVVVIIMFVVITNIDEDVEVPSTVTAMDVINDNLKDPVIVSRAYFTDTPDGPMGDFVGYPSSWPEDNRLHRFTHEKP